MDSQSLRGPHRCSWTVTPTKMACLPQYIDWGERGAVSLFPRDETTPLFWGLIPFPFFSTIVLFKNQIRFPSVSGWFPEKIRIPGKNGHGRYPWNFLCARKSQVLTKEEFLEQIEQPKVSRCNVTDLGSFSPPSDSETRFLDLFRWVGWVSEFHPRKVVHFERSIRRLELEVLRRARNRPQ